MIDMVPSDDDSVMWTLEEIGRLVSLSGDASETLANVVTLDSAPVQDGRLFGVPARTRSVQPGARGHDRPPPGQRRPRAHAPQRGAGRPGGRTAPAADRRGRHQASTIQVLPGDWRGSVQLVPGRSHHRTRSASGCAGRADNRVARLQRRRCADADDGRDAVGHNRQRGADARPGCRSGTSAAGSPRAEPVVELGQRRDEPVPGNRPGAVARVRQQSNRAAAPHVRRHARGTRVAAGAAQPNQLRVSPPGGVPAVHADLGRAPRRRPVGEAGRVLLRRVRPARVDSDLLRRPRDPGGRSHQECVGPWHPADRSRPVLRPGLLPAAAGHGRMAAGGLSQRRASADADGAGAPAAASR